MNIDREFIKDFWDYTKFIWLWLLAVIFVAILGLTANACGPCNICSDETVEETQDIPDYRDKPGTVTCIAPNSNVKLYEGKFKKVFEWNHHDGYKTHEFTDMNGDVIVVEGFCVKKYFVNYNDKPFYEQNEKQEKLDFQDPFE